MTCSECENEAKQLVAIKCDCLRDKHDRYLCKNCFQAWLVGNLVLTE